MAQAKVTEFFSQRKRTGNFQPSKRRKVEIIPDADSVSHILQTASDPVILENSQVNSVSVDPPKSTEIHPKNVAAGPEIKTTISETVSIKTTRTTRSKTPANQRAKTRGQKTKNDVKQQSKIVDVFEPTAVISSEPTAVCDDHCASPPSTPTKRESAKGKETGQKRSKQTGKERKDRLNAELQKTPVKGFDFSPYSSPTENEAAPEKQRVRKKLVLQKPEEEKTKEKSVNKVFVFKSPQPAAKEEHTARTPTKSSQSQAEPKTPSLKQNSKDADKEPSSSSLQSTPKRPAPTMKYATEGKSNVASVREQLSQPAGLEQLKERLMQMKGARQSPARARPPPRMRLFDESPEKTKPGDKTESAPPPAAILLSPVPSTLTLPPWLRLLNDTFQGCDTVVSMLTNRKETCTFSKLKAAVQSMMRRTFEENTLGQIARVYPDAYVFRQEKGLPVHGNRNQGYQLTVEVQLPDDGKTSEKDKKNKVNDVLPKFSAAMLVDRKATFHRKLIDNVKKYHEEFLDNLDRPLYVPGEKITRWHPQFPLDSVPEIIPADLPLPPDVVRITTARDALDQAKGCFSPRVRRALAIADSFTAEAENAKNIEKARLESTATSTPGDPPTTPVKGARPDEALPQMPGTPKTSRSHLAASNSSTFNAPSTPKTPSSSRPTPSTPSTPKTPVGYRPIPSTPSTPRTPVGYRPIPSTPSTPRTPVGYRPTPVTPRTPCTPGSSRLIPSTPSTPRTPGGSRLNGVSESLLERIRAKEAAKMEATLMRSAEQEKLTQSLSRLPELARILRSFCVTQKKPCVPLEDAIQKMGDSYKSQMSAVEAERHLKLLIELVPDWVSIITVKRGSFVKVDKNKDLNHVVEKLNKAYKKSQ